MKFEIEDFIAKLSTIQCSESIEFRSRFQKKWLLYQYNNCKVIQKELVHLINSYLNKKN